MSWDRERMKRELGGAMGLIRRMVRRFLFVGAPDGAWQLQGPGDEELAGVEVAGAGIGFSARPKRGSAEAVVIHVGGASLHPVIVGSIDHVHEPQLDEDDSTAVWNSQAIVLVKPDGTVEIRSRGGSAQALATKADVQVLRDWVATQFTGSGHTHKLGPTVVSDTVVLAVAAPNPPSSPQGTEILKGG